MALQGLEHMFSGEFFHQLDEKSRFKLPAKLLNLILKEFGIECVLMRMPEQCLAIYPAKVWRKYYSEILANFGPAVPGTADYRALTRIIGANSLEISIGAQGRVALPDGFRGHIGVEPGENVAVVGAGFRIEIWPESRWREFQEASMANYGDIVERSFENFGMSRRKEEETR